MSGLPSEMSGLFTDKAEMDMKQKIVEELLNNDKNLETKTELTQPVRWACMSMIKDVLKGKKLLFSSGLLNNFTKTAFTYLISKDRKGRLEYVDSLKSLTSTQPVAPQIQKLMER